MHASPLTIAYSDQYLNWHLNAPTNAVRAQNATNLLVERWATEAHVVVPVASADTRLAVESVHDRGYVAEVLDQHRSGEWSGQNPDNAATALAMFEGTRMLIPGLIDGQFRVGFNPQGAKHHAHFDCSSGFCVFNDMAWAALEFQRQGLRAVYIDWDAHAGDGVHHLLRNSDIPTFSIHNGSIFPGDPDMADLSRSSVTHTVFHPDHHAYSWALTSRSGDEALGSAVAEVLDMASSYEPDVILLATGADGHSADARMGGLNFTDAGFESAARGVAQLATEFAEGRVLIGGAGGYQPHDHTPRVWSLVVSTIYSGVSGAE